MRLLILGLALLLGTESVASTVSAKVEIHFDLFKIDHNCFTASGFPLSPGTCGNYQDLEFGEVANGSVSFDGTFSTGDGVVFNYLGGVETCSFGTIDCLIGRQSNQIYSNAIFTQDAITVQTFCCEVSPGITFPDFDGTFAWDLASGTGDHDWVDNSFAAGSIVFTNVVVQGLPQVQPIPLPAPLPLMVAGFFCLAYAKCAAARLRRTGRGSNFQLGAAF